jgi:hypothetical protein
MRKVTVEQTKTEHGSSAAAAKAPQAWGDDLQIVRVGDGSSAGDGFDVYETERDWGCDSFTTTRIGHYSSLAAAERACAARRRWRA